MDKSVEAYLVIADSFGFSPCWCITQKQLFDCFAPTYRNEIQKGLDSGKDFILTTEGNRYLIQKPTIPVFVLGD